jgi:hypothetical protein
MRIYVINYHKDGKEFKKVVLKMVNDLTGEEVFYSGFLREVTNQITWGKSGWLESYAEVYRDRKK